jgi:hypothetical protein
MQDHDGRTLADAARVQAHAIDFDHLIHGVHAGGPVYGFPS